MPALLQRHREHRGRRGLAVRARDQDAARRPAMSAASSSARCTTAMPRSRAATTSGLSAGTAVETTTRPGVAEVLRRRGRSTPARPSPRARMPPARRAGRCRVTGWPRCSRIDASALMPAPPMPDQVDGPGRGPACSGGGASAALTVAAPPRVRRRRGPAPPRARAASGRPDARAAARPSPAAVRRRAAAARASAHQARASSSSSGDDDGPAGVGQGSGVGRLVVGGGVGVRHEDAGQPEHGELGQRRCARTAHDDIRRGVGQVHALDEVDAAHERRRLAGAGQRRVPRRGDRLGVAAAGGVQDLQPLGLGHSARRTRRPRC